MRYIFVTAAALVLVSSPLSLSAQSDDATGTIAINDIVARMNDNEKAMIDRLRTYHPLIEVYIQHVVADAQLGWTPQNDDYLLGQFDLADKQPRFKELSESTATKADSHARKTVRFQPDGFAASAAPDWKLLTLDRYEFTFVRREVLGETRCFVFDVTPRAHQRIVAFHRDAPFTPTESPGFTGRIWIEDRNYNLVRFNGINRDFDQTLSRFFQQRLSFHMDGWRVNTAPGVWLPASVYSEETDLNDLKQPTKQPRFKSQVRIWGYQAQSAVAAQPQTSIRIDESTVVDDTTRPRRLSPILSQREWEQEAENNVVERLEKIGLLSPRGEVDTVLETVLNNLVVTNQVTLDRPLKCRVLLTTPFETFTVGRTIVVSRGLIDVLPDEASLAAMLAHELSHVVLGHALIDTKFAFADRLMVTDRDLLDTLRFQHSTGDEEAADQRAMQLLQASPYKDRLDGVALFVRTLEAHSQQLPHLIQPHIGDRIARGDVKRLAELASHAPALDAANLDQIPALPIGARTVLDPWSGRLTLDRSPAVAPTSAHEKEPLSVTPLIPYLTYVDAVPETRRQTSAVQH